MHDAEADLAIAKQEEQVMREKLSSVSMHGFMRRLKSHCLPGYFAGTVQLAEKYLFVSVYVFYFEVGL